ncbi:MAG TPA: hypothetical protein VF791_03435 [Pyrinomonadaceae bacterium]
MLATLPDPDGSIHKERIVESLRLCVDRATGGNITHFASLLGKPLGTFYGWYLGEVKIPLPDLLRVCYRVNLSVLDLLRGANIVAGKRFIVRESTDIPDVVISFRRPKPFKYSQVKSKLKRFLEIIPPISMAEKYQPGTENIRKVAMRLSELYERKRLNVQFCKFTPKLFMLRPV